MSTSNSFDAELSKLEWNLRHHRGWTALTLLGLFAGFAFVTWIGFVLPYRSNWRLLILLAYVPLVAAAVSMALRSRRARKRFELELARPSASLADASLLSGLVVVGGHLRCVESKRSFVLTDPSCPGWVAWIETPDLRAWRLQDGKPSKLVSPEDLWDEAHVVIVAVPRAVVDPSPAQQRYLAESGYREPPRLLMLEPSDAPVRIGLATQRAAVPAEEAAPQQRSSP